ncbi:hypothetical protein [Nocardiopsis protaetiae]|uniref:hypothetical protein n=1 Tax=Nocardiopsis protaetiae TaxID=3382270 RepID=UPI00387AE12A
MLRLPAVLSWLSAAVIPVVPHLRGLVPAQVEDAAVIEALGDRLDAYAGIETPTVLLTGARGQGTSMSGWRRWRGRCRMPGG